MEDYREIGPPGNGETRKTGASNLAAVRETTRHVRIHASRVIFRGALKVFLLTLRRLFRMIAPMRSRDNMRAVMEGIDPMEAEETEYWPDMAMH